MDKVLICVPTRGDIYYKVVGFLNKQAEMGFPTLFARSSYGIEAARKTLCDAFLRFDYSHLFFLDDDIIPPNDVISRLLSASTDMVTADYLMTQEGECFSHCSINGSRFTGKEEGLANIDACGLGACLIRKEVIQKCPNDFFVTYDGYDPIRSEDYNFCDKVRDKGFQIFCDFDVKCDHYKMMPLRG